MAFVGLRVTLHPQKSLVGENFFLFYFFRCDVDFTAVLWNQMCEFENHQSRQSPIAPWPEEGP